MTGEGRAPGSSSSGFLGPRLVALFLLVLATVLIVSAVGIHRGGGYSVIGPGTIPLAVAVGLLVLGVLFAARTSVLPDTDLATQAAEEEVVAHWPTVGLVAGVLVVYALALNGFRLGSIAVPGLGYVVATGLFLPAAAWTLGSRSWLRDLVIGFVLAIGIYIGFTQFLGVRLPAGVLGLVL
jgi:putative tricarboxylic transport membrane protein